MHADQIPSKSTIAVRAIRVESESSSSESDSNESEEDEDRCRVCVTKNPNQVKINQDHRGLNEEADRVELRDHGERSKPCNHCGSI